MPACTRRLLYSTGLDELDNLMVGFEGGTLTIVAGRPSMGKSQISLQLAFKMILLHDLPVAIFSLEMTKKQLEYRLWSLISVTNAYKHLGLTPLRSDRIRRHRARFEPLADWEFTLISKIVGIASELPLYMNDSRGITVSGIASECRQIKAKEGKLGLVVVDYLQMMAEDSGGNRSYELGDVARGLYKMGAIIQPPITPECDRILPNVENVMTSTPDPSVPSKLRSPLEESCTSCPSCESPLLTLADGCGVCGWLPNPPELKRKRPASGWLERQSSRSN